ncbi:CRAL/TRIO domain-containing protein [Ganoderma leucocontextum]|nr:CRAL/TRIO domain-containing protein [Ganoderma leucocontextum]
MSPKDQHVGLKEFREQLVHHELIHDGDTIGTDDETLLRFLRARNFSLKQTLIMWKNCQEWRHTVEGRGIDELYREIDPFDYPERDIVFESWPLYFHKLDKEGHPINLHHFGGIDLSKLEGKMSLEHFWQTVLVNCEALPREVLPAATQAAGKPILGTCVVVDLSGFGVSQFWQMKDFARRSFQVSQDYFPETVARLAIVNAPRGFATIWNVMKPWIAKETAQKVTIMGADYQHKLLEIIDPESLPAYLGGQCICDGPGGCMKSSAGPWMYNRRRRRDLWLDGARTTPALLPGEHDQEELGAEALGGALPPPQAGPTLSAGSGSSSDDTSSVETSSPATPPPCIEGNKAADLAKLELAVQYVYDAHPEARQVHNGGDLHHDASVHVIAH